MLLYYIIRINPKDILCGETSKGLRYIVLKGDANPTDLITNILNIYVKG